MSTLTFLSSQFADPSTEAPSMSLLLGQFGDCTIFQPDESQNKVCGMKEFSSDQAYDDCSSLRFLTQQFRAGTICPNLDLLLALSQQQTVGDCQHFLNPIDSGNNSDRMNALGYLTLFDNQDRSILPNLHFLHDFQDGQAEIKQMLPSMQVELVPVPPAPDAQKELSLVEAAHESSCTSPGAIVMPCEQNPVPRVVNGADNNKSALLQDLNHVETTDENVVQLAQKNSVLAPSPPPGRGQGRPNQWILDAIHAAQTPYFKSLNDVVDDENSDVNSARSCESRTSQISQSNSVQDQNDSYPGDERHRLFPRSSNPFWKSNKKSVDNSKVRGYARSTYSSAAATTRNSIACSRQVEQQLSRIKEEISSKRRAPPAGQPPSSRPVSRVSKMSKHSIQRKHNVIYDKTTYSVYTQVATSSPNQCFNPISDKIHDDRMVNSRSSSRHFVAQVDCSPSPREDNRALPMPAPIGMHTMEQKVPAPCITPVPHGMLTPQSVTPQFSPNTPASGRAAFGFSPDKVCSPRVMRLQKRFNAGDVAPPIPLGPNAAKRAPVDLCVVGKQILGNQQVSAPVHGFAKRNSNKRNCVVERQVSGAEDELEVQPVNRFTSARLPIVSSPNRDTFVGRYMENLYARAHHQQQTNVNQDVISVSNEPTPRKHQSRPVLQPSSPSPPCATNRRCGRIGPKIALRRPEGSPPKAAGNINNELPVPTVHSPWSARGNVTPQPVISTDVADPESSRKAQRPKLGLVEKKRTKWKGKA